MSTYELKKNSWINFLHTVAILVSLVGLLSFFAYILFGPWGMWASVGAIAAFLIVGPKVTPKLTMRLVRARPISEWEAPGLYELVDQLAQDAQLKARPHLYYLPDPSMNAISTGSDRQPYLAISDGLLSALSRREMAGVLAHEISHIAQGDLRIMALSQMLGRVISTLAFFVNIIVLINIPLILMGKAMIPIWMLATVAGVPWIALLLQFRLSRVREHHADLNAIRLTGDPEGFASALQKTKNFHMNFLRMFGNRGTANRPEWLSTHPDTEERIRRIMAYSGSELPRQDAMDDLFRTWIDEDRWAELRQLHSQRRPRPRVFTLFRRR